MSHYVKCVYCNSNFDRDKEAYVKPNGRRYGQAICYYREKQKNPQTPELEIFDPTDEVECAYCKKKFLKSKTSFKLLSNGKFVHDTCFELEQKRELTDKEKLDRFIIQLYEVDFVPPRVQKQVKEYIANYGYTYTGIAKTLEYMYTVKNIPVDKVAFDTYGIGLVKSYFDQAKRYYYAIWEAQQNQEAALENLSIEAFVPKSIEVSIPVPKRKELKRQLFTFLDAEEEENE